MRMTLIAIWLVSAFVCAWISALALIAAYGETGYKLDHAHVVFHFQGDHDLPISVD